VTCKAEGASPLGREGKCGRGGKWAYLDNNKIQPSATTLPPSGNSKLSTNVLEFGTEFAQIFSCKWAASYTGCVRLYNTYDSEYGKEERWIAIVPIIDDILLGFRARPVKIPPKPVLD
jgi:hypothetical protein